MHTGVDTGGDTVPAAAAAAFQPNEHNRIAKGLVTDPEALDPRIGAWDRQNDGREEPAAAATRSAAAAAVPPERQPRRDVFGGQVELSHSHVQRHVQEPKPVLAVWRRCRRGRWRARAGVGSGEWAGRHPGEASRCVSVRGIHEREIIK